MISCFSVSGVFSGASVIGRLIGTPFCSMGVTTMKMISSTRQTSTRGVTLMSAFSVVFCSLSAGLCHRCLFILGFLHEVNCHFGTGVGHLDREAVDTILKVVVRPDGRDGDEETAGGGEERFRDTGRDRGDTAAAGGHAGEGVDDAD